MTATRLRSITLLVATLAVPRHLAAQYVGLTLGRATSTVDWQYPAPPPDCRSCISDAFPSASRHAATTALMLHWRTANWLGAVTEARFAPKGYAITQPTLRVEYLQVPLLLRLGRVTGTGTGLRPFLEAGPAVALRLRCRVFYNNTSDACTQGAVFGQDWQLTRFDVSALAGGGVALQVRRTVVLAGGRVDYGLRDIGGPELVPTKHRAAFWYLGALVPLK